MNQPPEPTIMLSDADDIRQSFGFDQPEEQWFAQLHKAQSVDVLGRFGPYELLEEIGHGGQGAVYKARQPGTNRVIALKRLSAGSFATSSMRARFEREVEVASALSHPNIVRVYGTECIEGQQVLVMEWIDGVPIDRWANPADSSQNETSARPLRQLLEAFILVCDAVNHAHQRGVLHRDLKPSNVLVDSSDQPHVLDFGLAKLINPEEPRSALTHDTGFFGTPAYASPEHITGNAENIDARSDVYSLGVIAYQMLTGALPHGSAATIVELFDAIRTHTPARPSSLRRDMNRELDAIVLKALEKDPARRYQSVEGLAADVRRFLNNETVLAHPPSAAYQARKFISRHRSMFTAAMIVLVTLVGALIGVATALVQTQAAQEQTRNAQLTASQVNEFLNQMLAAADPTVIRAHDVPVAALLDEAVRKLDGGALREQPEAEAQVRTSLANSYKSLGLYAAAQSQYEKSLACWKLVEGDHQVDIAQVMMRLIDVLRREEDFETARRLADQAHAIFHAAFGADHEMTIRAQWKRALCRISLGDRSARQTLCDLFHQAVRVTGNEVIDLVIDVKGDLAFHGGCTNDPAESLRLLEETLAAQRQLYGPDDERSARTLVNLGALLADIGKHADAERFILQALEMRRRIYGDDHPAVASALYNLGNVSRRLHGFEVAEQHYRQALAIQERRLTPGHYETARCRYRLGQMLYRQNKFDEAETVFRQSMAEFDKQPHAHVAVRRNWAARYIAQLLILQRQFEEAEAVLLDAMHQAQTRFSNTDEPYHVAASFVQLYEAWGRDEQAIFWRAKQQSSTPNRPTDDKSN
nr:hypothetical protein [uncultured bacterium]